jgi:hypothetical protein
MAVLLAFGPLGAMGCNASRQGPPQNGDVVERADVGNSASAEALAAGYRERLRLGLGSPFRLMESVLADPRLEEGNRQEIARELFERTRRGDAYHIDPAALLSTLSPPTPDLLALATAQLELIDRAVSGPADPRTGELAVRLGFRLAQMEGTIDSVTFTGGVEAASLVRDRELARRDARRLLGAAHQQKRDPLELIAAWRRERRLLVETPALRYMPAGDEREAIHLAPGLRATLRGFLSRPAPFTELPGPPTASPEELARLAELALATRLPPRAPVVLAVRWPGYGLEGAARGVRWGAWTKFAATTLNEEDFAGRLRALVAGEPTLRTIGAKAAVRAAVAMRPYAQEPVWFPGMARPTTEEIRGRYGVRVQVDSGVPVPWRPYYLGALEGMIQDLKSLAPSATLQGLTIHLLTEPSRPDALALHRAGSRTLEWPVTTGSGALAHEIAHDLDRQAALRASPKQKGYASNHAAARGRTSFASALSELSPERVGEPGVVDGEGLPAEVLARSFEWFVVTRLAAQGRWNGTLATAQDEVLTGHTGVRAPAIGGEYGPAVIAALRPLLRLPPEEAQGFLSAYGPARQPGAYLFLRSATAVGLPLTADSTDAASHYRSLRIIAAARDRAIAELDAWLCGPTAPFVEPATAAAYRALIAEAIAAQLRSVAPTAEPELAWSAALAEMQPGFSRSAFQARPTNAFCRAAAHASPGSAFRP